MSIRFAAVGLSHSHIYDIVQQLLSAGAELVWVFGAEPENLATFTQKFPQARLADSVERVLEDTSIQLIASAGIPDERAPLGVRAMQHGKDYVSDKPGFVSLEQLAEVRKVQAETARIYSIYFGERFGNAATVRAGELVHSGAIGRVIQTVGFGPHRLFGHLTRPPWFFQRARFGGILNDIASHQIDQFLYFTGSTSAEVVAAQVGNFNHPDYPELEDFGDVMLRSEQGAGYIRVDWFTPSGLSTWGDGRLFILGTDGYLEARKYCDIGGREGGDHLFYVDKQGMHYVDCRHVNLPYAAQLIADIVNRTETAMPQAHCFLASELALKGQRQAVRVGFGWL